MNFQTIQPLNDTIGTLSKLNKESSDNQQSTMFADIFESVIENVKNTDAEKNQKAYELAIGQLDNPAELTIASTKAELSVNMMVELRNRALEAYNEIIRMSL